MMLTGMDDLLQQLADAPQIEAPLKQIIRRRTSELNRKAQRYAPVATGELRRSIISTFPDGGLSSVTRAGMHYAPYVEYGTRFMSAQPFMRPAFYEVIWDYREDLERLVR